MSLAKKIVQLRKERNLTQKELASIVGVHFSHMSRYERGISLPSIDVVKKLAQMFHVSADYLLFDESQATVRAHIADQELLQQFERISRIQATTSAVLIQSLPSPRTYAGHRGAETLSAIIIAPLIIERLPSTAQLAVAALLFRPPASFAQNRA